MLLGTGASVPTPHRALPAIAVLRKGELLLFDAGDGTQRQMTKARIGFGRPMRIFVTHLHGDHVFGIPPMLHTMSMLKRKRPLYIYGPPGISDFFQCLRRSVSFYLSFPLRVFEVKPGIVCETREYVVRAVEVEHGMPAFAYSLEEKPRPGKFYPEKARALGVPEGPLWHKLQHGEPVQLPDGRIIRPEEVVGPPRKGRKIVYSGDTRPCDAVVELARGADLLIHDSTYAEELKDKAIENYHSTCVEAAEVAKKAGVRKLVLVHISARYEDPSLLEIQAKKVFPNAVAGRDLMTLEIPYSE